MSYHNINTSTTTSTTKTTKTKLIRNIKIDTL